MNTPNTQDLTPALFTAAELQHLRRAVKDADSDHTRRFFEAGIQRAAEHVRAKKEAKAK